MTGPVAIRYPRGGEGAFTADTSAGDFAELRTGKDITLCAYGTLINNVLGAAELLHEDGIEARVVKLNRISPFRGGELSKCFGTTKRLLVAEECLGVGCIGQRIAAILAEEGHEPQRLTLCNLGRRFIEQGSVGELYRQCGLDAESLAHGKGGLPMSTKERLDVALVARGLAETRAKAQASIMSGIVYVNGQKVDKAGTPVAADAVLEVRGHTLRYVSRGGLKLEKAMAAFPITLTDCICADIGASTGGFTDCMLQNGAKKVYAVDVGYGQLDWRLRSDERVVCMERTNARYLTHEQIPDELDFASVDVSFISLKLILPALAGLLKPDGHAVCLVKPQFEAGREKVGKKGVVRDPAVHLEVLEHFLEHAKESHFTVLGLTYSPIRGPEGNIEYLGYLSRAEEEPPVHDLKALVEASHAALEEKKGENDA